LLLFWVKREETRGDGAHQSLSYPLPSSRSQAFLGKHSHDEDALVCPFSRFSDGSLLACYLLQRLLVMYHYLVTFYEMILLAGYLPLAACDLLLYDMPRY
jgi:hypothetical protein